MMLLEQGDDLDLLGCEVRAWPEGMGIKYYLKFVPEEMTKDKLEREYIDLFFHGSFI